MKLASLKHGRDGQLVIVSADLTKAVMATDIAPTLQAALDDWDHVKNVLEDRAKKLADGTADHIIDFDPKHCASPLPRAYQWADGSAYVNHVELVRKARGAELPESFWTDPLMYQGGSDSFIGPYDDILAESEDWGIDFEAEIAVITGDVPMGVSEEEAGKYIRLIMLCNDVSLRNLIPAELAKGFGFFQAKPSSSFSPVAITPDELSDVWQDYRINLPVTIHLNGEKFGAPLAGEDMIFNFAKLIAHAAKTRPLCAGSIIGSGTVSNKGQAHGSGCLAEVRMLEKIETGDFKTPFMKFGDTVKLEMLDKDGNSIFGAIEQTARQYKKT